MVRRGLAQEGDDFGRAFFGDGLTVLEQAGTVTANGILRYGLGLFERLALCYTPERGDANHIPPFGGFLKNDRVARVA